MHPRVAGTAWNHFRRFAEEVGRPDYLKEWGVWVGEKKGDDLETALLGFVGWGFHNLKACCPRSLAGYVTGLQRKLRRDTDGFKFVSARVASVKSVLRRLPQETKPRLPFKLEALERLVSQEGEDIAVRLGCLRGMALLLRVSEYGGEEERRYEELSKQGRMEERGQVDERGG